MKKHIFYLFAFLFSLNAFAQPTTGTTTAGAALSKFGTVDARDGIRINGVPIVTSTVASVKGSGTQGNYPIWTGTSSIGNANLKDAGLNTEVPSGYYLSGNDTSYGRIWFGEDGNRTLQIQMSSVTAVYLDTTIVNLNTPECQISVGNGGIGGLGIYTGSTLAQAVIIDNYGDIGFSGDALFTKSVTVHGIFTTSAIVYADGNQAQNNILISNASGMASWANAASTYSTTFVGVGPAITNNYLQKGVTGNKISDGGWSIQGGNAMIPDGEYNIGSASFPAGTFTNRNQTTYGTITTSVLAVTNKATVASTLIAAQVISSDGVFGVGALFTGSVGIGTTSAPVSALEVVSTTSLSGIFTTKYDNGANGGGFIGRHANGTQASPSALLLDQSLSDYGGRGYGSTGFSTATRGLISIKAAENWTDAAQGTYITFENTSTGSNTRSERLRIDAGGNLGLNTIAGANQHISAIKNFSVNATTTGILLNYTNALSTVSVSSSVRGIVLTTNHEFTSTTNSGNILNSMDLTSTIGGGGAFGSGGLLGASIGVAITSSLTTLSTVDARMLQIKSPNYSYSVTTPATTTGIDVLNLGVDGGTTSRALFVRSQSGSTNNYAIIVAGNNFSGFGLSSPTEMVDVAGNIEATGSIMSTTVIINGGAPIKGWLSSTATLDFGNTLAGTVTDLTMTVTGAADGDIVQLGVPNASYPGTGTFTAWVSASNTVTIRYANNSLTLAQDPASGTFRAAVVKN